MRLKPIGDNVIIKPRLIAQDGKRAIGIMVAETRRQGIPKLGTIIEIGPDAKKNWPAVDISVGDKVIFKSQNSFKVYTVENVDYTIVKPNEIFGKIDKFNDGFDE